ncbi:MAG: alpha-mannosidase [Acidimicrobiales bacterium]|jgi:mannosylglycerate hydrolase|nr:alpha-mannosidase [Acidimicrobiales bacterium]
MADPPRTIAVVPHTHWDREWYAPFQAFRLRLVHLLDEFLPRLEADPSYARFLLDGQMAVVDDYLEVRPEAEDRIRRLAASGRLAMGPWYVLMDEFCVSGETIVRDLQLGIERAAAFGGAMNVGYLPDMFGHVAQMPQILRLAGFGHAVVWRGVPSSVDRTAFWWSAPDGSTVRAEHLWVGYGNGAAMPDDAKALVARIRSHEAELGDALPAGAPMLWMNGTDHQAPQRWLGRVVTEANDLQDDYRLVVTSLPEYLADAPVTGLPSWSGELRSAARSNLLMGVLSNRVDVKQAAARAERELERRAEPLNALFAPADHWPGRLLDLAWREVIRNAAHDSICACSVDDVADAVLHRFAEATTAAAGLARHGLRFLAATLAERGPHAVNPSARARSGLVEVRLPGGAAAAGPNEQVVWSRSDAVVERETTGAGLSIALGQLRNDELADGLDFSSIDVEDSDGTIDVVLRSGVGRAQVASTAASINDLYALAGGRRTDRLRIRVERDGFRRSLVRVTGAPGFGWRHIEPAATLDVAPARAGLEPSAWLDNGIVRVEVDQESGTFAINGLAGFDQLVDDGDHGDTYNWSPPANDTVVHHPAFVATEVADTGPLRATLRVVRSFDWPAAVVGDERVGTRRTEVTTEIELRAGEHVVRVTTSLDNQSRDHRMRTWFPLPAPATTSRAECAFATVERGLTAEGGPHELPLPTFPSRRFVQAGGLTVLHEGLLEYELVRIENGAASALALTLLRCTGLISGTEMAARPLPAGPPIAVEGPQLPGRRSFRYALSVDPDADPYALVDDVFLPMEVVTGVGQADRPPEGTALTVDGAEVSALRRDAGGALELRVFNPRPEPTTVAVDGRRGWLVDLRGRPLAPFDGSFVLAAWGIATAHLAE